MLQIATWDAVVAGGGPAGAAFALELARHGRRVVLLERSREAEHKVCGEFLSPETVRLLAYLGVDTHVLGAPAINQFRLVKAEQRADMALPFEASSLSRRRLDEALLSAVVHADVEVVRGVRVTDVESVGDAGIVKSQDGRWRGRAVALATGKHNVRGSGRPMGSMVGFKLHLASDAARQLLANAVQLAFFRGGYIGSCLVEQDTLSLGWVMSEKLLNAIGAKWETQRDFLSKQSPHVAALLDDARPLFAKPVSTAGIPYGYLRSRPIGPAIYALGDQLAVVPSFTGDGLAIALCSGIAAARAVLDGRSAGAFQRGFVGRLRPQFRVAGALGALLETPALSGASVAAARLMPSVAARLVLATRLKGIEALLADRSPQRLPVRVS